MNEVQADRRKSPRSSDIVSYGLGGVRIRPGHHAEWVDVSSGGALLETTRRLLPGAAVDLLVETKAGPAPVRGRVVRCSVSKLFPAAVWYRGAVEFDRHLPWHVDRQGTAIPATERDARRHTRVDATRLVV